MHTGKAKGSELIIFDDGTLYHIDIGRKDNIPPNLFLVGAAERVDAIACKFDETTFSHRNGARPEFYIKSGMYRGIPMAAMSIGIGVSNVEIILNEFHALFEYNHHEDQWADEKPAINIIRVGTCGAFQKGVQAGALVISEYGLGLDNLGAYYPAPAQDPVCASIEAQFKQTVVGKTNPLAYCSKATPRVARLLKETAYRLGESEDMVYSGITTAAPGFFAPEGRRIGRMQTAFSAREFLDAVENFDQEGLKIINTEMESSILFRIAHEHLCYNAGTICMVLDNLVTDSVISHDHARTRMDACITIALETMAGLAGEQ